LFYLHFLYLNCYSATVTLASLLKPAVRSVYLTLVTARKYTDLWLLVPVLAIKPRQRKILKQEVKVRKKDTPKVYYSDLLI
jgi:hypothetical protein